MEILIVIQEAESVIKGICTSHGEAVKIPKADGPESGESNDSKL